MTIEGTCTLVQAWLEHLVDDREEHTRLPRRQDP